MDMFQITRVGCSKPESFCYNAIGSLLQREFVTVSDKQLACLMSFDRRFMSAQNTHYSQAAVSVWYVMSDREYRRFWS